LADTRLMLIRETIRETKESQMKILSLQVDERRKLLDLSNKKIENAKIKISVCEGLLTKVVSVDNGLDDCTKGTWPCSIIARYIIVHKHV